MLRKALLTICLCLVASLAGAQGTTVITHGFQIDGVFPNWGVVKGIAIAQLSPAGQPQGTVLVYDPATGSWNSVFGSNDPAGELILVFDWAADSAWLPGDDFRSGSAHGAADALYATLRDPIVVGALSGVSFLEVSPGVARRTHFIGHSRGTTVNSETVRRLVVAGFPVDHVTTLDPHPAGPVANLLDPQPQTWEGVAFADNYWRADGCDLDYGCFGFDFDGQTIPGTFNVDIDLDAFSFLDNRLSACSLEHILVHTWYHGTVDLFVADDGDCSIDRSDWYINDGLQEGYFLAERGGGAGQRPCGPPGGCPDAGRVVATPPAPILNGDFEFGAGQDAGWRWHGGGGPGSIIDEPGNAFLTLSAAGSSREHNIFFVPSATTNLRYDLRVFTTDPAATLEIVLIDPLAGLENLVESVALTSPTGWETRSANLAGIPTGNTYRLAVRLSNATTAVADLDNFSLEAAPAAPQFLRGDCNGDLQRDVSDAVFVLGAIFGVGTFPPCLVACDGNDDGFFNIADSVSILSSLFGVSGPLPAPGPDCGEDPTPDALDCVSPPACP